MESIDVQTLEQERDVDGLIAALHDSSVPDVREAAARSLGNVGDERAVDPLLQVLNDPQSFESLREAVIAGLGMLGDRRATQPLLQALDEAREKKRAGSRLSSPEMRALYQALAKLGDERAVEPLLHTLDEESAANRADAESPLVVAGVDVRRLRNCSMLAALCEALASFKDDRAVEPMIDLLWEIQAEAESEKSGWTRDQWGRWANQPPQGLPQGSLATSLIHSLGELGDERAVAAIVEWKPLIKDYYVSAGDAFPSLDRSKLPGRYAKQARVHDTHRFPLEDACIKALRNIDGDKARNALSRFGVKERYLP